MESAKNGAFAAHASGSGFAPGYFLFDDENCVRTTVQIDLVHAENNNPIEKNGGLLIPAGSFYESADVNGILYEDVFIPDPTHPDYVPAVTASVVVSGTIDLSKAPALEEAAEALGAQGFKFVDSGAVERPY